MASRRTKFTVGLFVTFGIGIALLAFIWLGMSRFLEKGNYYATYFNESVQGLDIDSPVKYRGVTIGRVDSIGVAPDSKLIQVILKIETGQKLDDDIVAQISLVGITGSMFVELDRKEEGKPDQSPVLDFPSEYPIISSKPSLLKGINDVLTQLGSLDLEGIAEKITMTLDNANQAIINADIETISAGIESSVEDIQRIVDRNRWDRILASVEEAVSSLNNIMAKADVSLGHVDNTVGRLERITVEKAETIEAAIDEFKSAAEKADALMEKGTLLVNGTDESLSDLKQYLLVIARNLEQASENINRLTETIADHPSQLLFGEPPAPRKLEGE